jgi:hypothetical protein
MAALTATEDVVPTGWLAVAERGSIVGIRVVVWLATVLGRAPARVGGRAGAAENVLVSAYVRRV